LVHHLELGREVPSRMAGLRRRLDVDPTKGARPIT
jgi:hypothetical protein